MESTNLHHHHHHQQQQLQGQLVSSSSSSSLSSSSSYGASAASSSTPTWTQKLSFNPNSNGVSNSTTNISMIQDISFQHWYNNSNAATHHHQLSRIKQEYSDSFPRFTDLLNTTPSSNIEDSSSPPPPTPYVEEDQKDMADLSENLLLNSTLSSGYPQIFSNSTYNSSFGTSRFTQIYPSINISNLNRSPSPSPSPSQSPSMSGSSFDINLQALDLLTSKRFNASSFGQSSLNNNNNNNNNLAMYNGQMQSCSPSEISSFTTNETMETKRPSPSLMEPKATQAAPKKSRLESRASCPPFKVRKEKLGDRIAALQQLVAPFGKTDTASVLMEAIGYIKFLQNQVETLSVPYMKSTRNRTSTRTTQTFQGSTAEEGHDDHPKKDLRSRGLCLVPISCMSYVTGDGSNGGGGMWPPPNFCGGT